MENDELAAEVVYPPSYRAVILPAGFLNVLASFACFFSFASLMLNKAVRSNAYNIYVAFLILPDAMQSLITGLDFIFVGINNGRLFPTKFFEVKIFVWFFYFASNFYLNAIVCYEINTLVMNSYKRKRTPPPKLDRVYKQVAGVYLFAVIIGFWTSLQVPWTLFDIQDSRRGIGVMGSPSPGGVFSEMVATGIGFFIIIIPIIYVLYVRIRIGMKKLLPKKGRTRVLSLFFMRIVIVFLLFYLPSTILSTIRSGMADESKAVWLDTTAVVWTAVQVFVTLYMMALKDDIRNAVLDAAKLAFGRCSCSCTSSGEKDERKTTVASTRSISSPIIKNKWDESDVYSSKFNLSMSLRNSRNSHPPSQHLNHSLDQSLSRSLNQSLNEKKSEWEQEDVYDDDDAEPQRKQDDVETPPASSKDDDAKIPEESATCEGDSNNDREATGVDEETSQQYSSRVNFAGEVESSSPN